MFYYSVHVVGLPPWLISKTDCAVDEITVAHPCKRRGLRLMACKKVATTTNLKGRHDLVSKSPMAEKIDLILVLYCMFIDCSHGTKSYGFGESIPFHS